MGVLRVVACTLLSLALLPVLCLAASAGNLAPIEISPGTVGVGVNFGGADVAVRGKAPEGTQLVVKVSSQPETVRLSKKGRVMGIFWMTTERAVVENMPSFYAVYSSQPLETLLDKEEQSRIGVDTECTGLMAQARVVSDSADHGALPADQAQAYVTSLRDMYIKSGRYVPCMSCHRVQPETPAGQSAATQPAQMTVHLTRSDWSLNVKLPADTPLGEYNVTAYYIQGGKVIDSQSATFDVEKVGIVETLGTLATQNGVVYGAMALAIVVATGLTIGFIFPKGGGH